MFKFSISKGLLMTAPLLAVGLAAAWAHAGYKVVSDVVVSTDGSYAYGAMGSARASNGNFQRIGCSTYATTGSTTVICSARNAVGTSVQCRSSNSRHVAAVQSCNGDSFVDFSWDAAGNCIEIAILNQSYYTPKML
jgi:hypothetical protein